MDEASIVDERCNYRIATVAELNQMAISAKPVDLTKSAVRFAKKQAEMFNKKLKVMLKES